jgi:hypothetical protein
MSRTMTGAIVGLGVLALAAGVLVTGLLGGGGQVGNAAAELGVVTATAVGIERVLEACWVIVGQLANAWWPLNVPAKQLDAFVTSLDQQLEPFLTGAEQAIAQAKQAGDRAPDELAAAEALLRTAQQYVDQVSVASPPTQGEAATIMAAIDGLRSLFPTLQGEAVVAKGFIGDLASFASSFNENPARKLISLYAGSVLGVLVAAFTRIDLFAASGITTTQFHGFAWGVALTGVVMGLGSNPTHEIIKAVQEYKNNQKRQAETFST